MHPTLMARPGHRLRSIVFRVAAHLCCVSVLLAGVTACVTHPAPASGSARVPGGPAASGSAPERRTGVAATTLTCDRFPSSAIRDAIRGLVPSAVVDVAPSSPDPGNPDARRCTFTLFTPGTDLDSADRGMVQVAITVQDFWSGMQVTGLDNDVVEKRNFEWVRASAQAANSGAPEENGARSDYQDVSDLGAAAYLVDTTHTTDGAISGYHETLSVLHTPRPYRLEASFNYVIPQPDQPLPDRALDRAMHGQADRRKLAEAIGRVALARI